MQPDQVIGGRYKIIGPLGEGGMANVYRAYDMILDREVALKIMRLDMRDDPIAKKRFENEIRASTELVHPNITQVYDYGDDDGNQYLVTEYISGPDLKRYETDNFPLPLTKVVDIMGQVLSGVQEAHNHGIIHRDLKPQNVLMTVDGTAKITDFGIARAQSSFGMTQTNMAIGSVHYMAPEQVRGEPATPQSDIYSLGIMLYELLAGKVPFDGETSVAVAIKHTTDPMPLVRENDPRIPQAVENVILKATAKNPLERYDSANAMRMDLATALSPDRVNEARWISPSVNDETEPTKVMTTIKGQSTANEAKLSEKTATVMAVNRDNDEATATTAGQADQQPKPFYKKKRVWLVGILAVLAAFIIGLTIYGMQTPKQATVPDVQDMSLQSAKDELAAANLKPGTITYKYSETTRSGDVLASQPKAGAHVARDAKIKLTVSKGPHKIRFGDYRNEAYETVADRLKAKGYTVTNSHEHSDSVPVGYIIKQSIKPDKKVIPNKTTVNFVVSMGPEKIDLPQASQKSVEDSEAVSRATNPSVASSKSERREESSTSETSQSTSSTDSEKPDTSSNSEVSPSTPQVSSSSSTTVSGPND
ncbi:Stk1 family PASTA domain-containing Ser/Thr kinase [Weissella viridescens]|uniref:Stk1 family PASTA domain-containing Ser/Thr kinase n=1 Tax=Weissella viridescens TaxID=1629 RepID=UPI001D05C586|nr:Stk1 family PASTA domain-containing Ser/Thr kinase [Weissella viridescens]MCB6840405.1 Stk1 family PASTA domain-containing Ser/Thr kinase [Weissella viridescens]MCB6847138.1 Stk1 family PASTA domain-containing Ser/Thr kinase [Weissella viridescens]